MSYERLNAYKVMWLVVFFDLPTHTAQDRKQAAGFRKTLLKDGFGMMQFSVYLRHCASLQSMELHKKRIQSALPPKGHVSLLSITDKQYGLMNNYWGRQTQENRPPPLQLEMF